MAATSTAVHRVEEPVTSARSTLQQFAVAAASSGGVLLDTLDAIDQIEVRTRNTTYHITVLGGTEARVLVQGGRYFPVQSEVRLNGSTLGGSLLKVGWIGCGFCMEFMHDGQRITTTRVREIRRLDPTGPALH